MHVTHVTIVTMHYVLYPFQFSCECAQKALAIRKQEHVRMMYGGSHLKFVIVDSCNCIVGAIFHHQPSSSQMAGFDAIQKTPQNLITALERDSFFLILQHGHFGHVFLHAAKIGNCGKTGSRRWVLNVPSRAYVDSSTLKTWLQKSVAFQNQVEALDSWKVGAGPRKDRRAAQHVWAH